MNKKEKAEDRRLRKCYGIPLKERREMERAQNNKCKICGRPPGKKALHVDHDHKIARAKIKTWNLEGWWAKDVEGLISPQSGNTKSEAIQKAKAVLKKISVRGLLCFRCNRRLVGNNSKELLQKAAWYLEDFETRLNKNKGLYT